MERIWMEKEEEEDFNEVKETITEIACQVHLARDRDKIVRTDPSKTRVGII